jgi:accessory colonization factor AcfC
MKRLSFVIAISAALSVTAFAKIGDDEKQIESVYGKPAKVLEEKGSAKKVGYSAGQVAVVVDFVNGLSRREGFAKPDTSMFKEDEIKQILDVSAAQNTTWKEEAGKAGDRKWKRSDGKAEAFFPARQTYFVVQDVSFAPPE